MQINGAKRKGRSQKAEEEKVNFWVAKLENLTSIFCDPRDVWFIEMLHKSTVRKGKSGRKSGENRKAEDTKVWS